VIAALYSSPHSISEQPMFFFLRTMQTLMGKQGRGGKKKRKEPHSIISLTNQTNGSSSVGDVKEEETSQQRIEWWWAFEHFFSRVVEERPHAFHRA
jgi:hypothetical protein